jgi:hypothetical protein
MQAIHAPELEVSACVAPADRRRSRTGEKTKPPAPQEHHSNGGTVPSHRYSDVPRAQKLRKLALTSQSHHRFNRPELAPSEKGAFRISPTPTLCPAARTLAATVPRSPFSPASGISAPPRIPQTYAEFRDFRLGIGFPVAQTNPRLFAFQVLAARAIDNKRSSMTVECSLTALAADALQARHATHRNSRNRVNGAATPAIRGRLLGRHCDCRLGAYRVAARGAKRSPCRRDRLRREAATPSAPATSLSWRDAM